MTPLSRPELEELKQHIAIGILTRDERIRVLAAVPALLESASFAERALELLRSMDQVAKETDDCPCCATLRVYPNFPNTDNCETEHEPGCALAELLRSIPAQPAKEKPDAT